MILHGLQYNGFSILSTDINEWTTLNDQGCSKHGPWMFCPNRIYKCPICSRTTLLEQSRLSPTMLAPRLQALPRLSQDYLKHSLTVYYHWDIPDISGISHKLEEPLVLTWLCVLLTCSGSPIGTVSVLCELRTCGRLDTRNKRRVRHVHHLYTDNNARYMTLSLHTGLQRNCGVKE